MQKDRVRYPFGLRSVLIILCKGYYQRVDEKFSFLGEALWTSATNRFEATFPYYDCLW